MFGTFRDRLKETGTSYSGAAEGRLDEKAAIVHDSRASLQGRPDAGFAIYLGLNCAVWLMVWLVATEQPGPGDWRPHALALLAGAGPVLLAQAMASLTDSTGRGLLYPFHREAWGTLSLHLVVGTVICILPVYVLVHTILSPPGHALYFWLRS
jgi:hypothetical protein